MEIHYDLSKAMFACNIPRTTTLYTGEGSVETPLTDPSGQWRKVGREIMEFIRRAKGKWSGKQKGLDRNPERDQEVVPTRTNRRAVSHENGYPD